MDKRHIPWKSVSAESVITDDPQYELFLDNDAETLGKERALFEQKLRQIDPALTIFSIENDEEGMGDRFILNTRALSHIDKIKEIFNHNAIQYEVGVGLFPVPIEGFSSKTHTPRQQTVFIYRKAFKKLKQQPIWTIINAAVCIFFIALFLGTLGRVVL